MFTRPALGFSCLIALTEISSAEMLWGINGHPLTAYPGIGIEQQLDFIKELGAKSYRVNISDQSGIETLETLVEEGRARGITILPVITPGDIDLEKDSAEALYTSTRKFAFSLSSRFREDIRVWELGNELENHAIIQPCEKRDDGTQYSCEWGPAGGNSELDYFGPRWVKVSAVLKGLSDGVSDADPTLRKAIGTAGWGHTGAFDRMRKDGIDWDISVWHMYGEDPEWAFRKLAVYERPIWVTEFNHPKGSEAGDQQQANGLRQTMARLAELQGKYNVQAAYIYELLDEPYWAPSYEAAMGLVRLTPTRVGEGWAIGEPKPAYLAAREFLRGPLPVARPQRNCELDAVQAVQTARVRQAAFGYCLVFGHSADPEALEHWTAALTQGNDNFAEMLTVMMRSDQFLKRYPTLAMSDRTFVNFVYLLLLGRGADNYGMTSYLQQLAKGSMSREDVTVGIVQSSEFQSKHAAPLNNTANADGAAATPPG